MRLSHRSSNSCYGGRKWQLKKERREKKGNVWEDKRRERQRIKGSPVWWSRSARAREVSWDGEGDGEGDGEVCWCKRMESGGWERQRKRTEDDGGERRRREKRSEWKNTCGTNRKREESEMRAWWLSEVEDDFRSFIKVKLTQCKNNPTN